MPLWRILVTTASAAVIAYIGGYIWYASTHWLPPEELNPMMAADGRSAVWYGNQNLPGSRATFLFFYPAQCLAWHLFAIDAQVHQGDSFWLEWTGDAYVDDPRMMPPIQRP